MAVQLRVQPGSYPLRRGATMRKNMNILGKFGTNRLSCWTDAVRSAAIKRMNTDEFKRQVIAYVGWGG